MVPIPGLTAEGERYVRDLYDHLIRISDMVDSYRDLLSGSLDAYMSMVSNRLNDVMKQLTIIATVFLPLSFLTGFFGQNFAWMVVRLGSLGAFLALGIGTEVLAVVALVTLFRTRGWMGKRQKILKTLMAERAVVRALIRSPPLRAGRDGTDSLSCEAWCLLRKGRFRDGVVTGSRCRAAFA